MVRLSSPAFPQIVKPLIADSSCCKAASRIIDPKAAIGSEVFRPVQQGYPGKFAGNGFPGTRGGGPALPATNEPMECPGSGALLKTTANLMTLGGRALCPPHHHAQIRHCRGGEVNEENGKF